MAAKLPETLTPEPVVVWKEPLLSPGLGGVAANDKIVIASGRDLLNASDQWQCFDAETGLILWSLIYPAPGELDYGNSPRATPLIMGDKAYLLGAMGDLHCVNTTTGEVVWKKQLRTEYEVKTEAVWGYCSSPLIAGDILVVNPGGAKASLVGLNPKTGKEVWRTPGESYGYGSLISATLGGVEQVIGHDRKSLGGWNAKTGERLWKVVPPNDGDFNVPTPLVIGDQLLVVTENNGSRLFSFQQGGVINSKPVAVNQDLAPDMSSPVLVGGKVWCVWGDLFRLDSKSLKEDYTASDAAFADYAAIIGGKDRILVIGAGGRLVLGDAKTEKWKKLGSLSPFGKGEFEYYSHPALVGDRLYMRGKASILCLDLNGE